MREFEQIMPAAPRWQTGEGIGTDDQRDRPVAAVFGAQLVQRVDRETRSMPRQLARVDGEIGMTSHRDFQHAPPLLRRCQRLRAMRRHLRRHQVHDGSERMRRFEGRTQMPDVDRIEGAAQ